MGKTRRSPNCGRLFTTISARHQQIPVCLKECQLQCVDKWEVQGASCRCACPQPFSTACRSLRCQEGRLSWATAFSISTAHWQALAAVACSSNGDATHSLSRSSYQSDHVGSPEIVAHVLQLDAEQSDSLPSSSGGTQLQKGESIRWENVMEQVFLTC